MFSVVLEFSHRPCFFLYWQHTYGNGSEYMARRPPTHSCAWSPPSLDGEKVLVELCSLPNARAKVDPNWMSGTPIVYGRAFLISRWMSVHAFLVCRRMKSRDRAFLIFQRMPAGPVALPIVGDLVF
jgi:hypothetical protein